jgi:hypothetical protein
MKYYSTKNLYSAKQYSQKKWVDVTAAAVVGVVVVNILKAMISKYVNKEHNFSC